MKELKIAVIGLGIRGSLANRVHRPGGGSRIAACAELDPAVLDEARARFGADTMYVTDHRRLLSADLDGVLVLTPDDSHEAIAVDFLEAGVPVFVDKPLAITPEGCDRILATARAYGTRLYVGHNMRHMQVIIAMRELIAAGEIGQVKAIWCRHFIGHGGDYYFKDWHADRRRTTSLLVQKGAHDLDIIHWLAGGYSARVTALGNLAVYGQVESRRDRSGERMTDWLDPEHNWPPLDSRDMSPVMDVEDLSMMLMELDNGVLASYQQCHFTPDYWRNYTVIGTQGRLENFGDTEHAVVKVWKRRSNYRDDADLLVEVPDGAGSHGGADPLVVDEFLRFIRTGGPTITSPVAARHAVVAGCAATHSLRHGGIPVEVPELDPELVAYFAQGQT